MTPEWYWDDCGHERDAQDVGVPPVEDGEEHDPTEEEGEKHHDAIDHVDQTLLQVRRGEGGWADEDRIIYLHVEVNQDHPQGHKGGAGLDHEAGPQQAVSVSIPEVHEGREAYQRHEDVVEDNQWTVW